MFAKEQSKLQLKLMLIHTVFFWLKDDLDDADRSLFFRGVEQLGAITSVEDNFIGTPANTTKRPVVDDSYDCSLTVVLKGLKEHDAYQVDPIHLYFIKNYAHLWKKVQIFDAD
jgi:hypothetical protein